MKNILLIILIFFTVKPAISQTEELNLQKYWYYRYRLKQYYVVVGDEPGNGLPARRRSRYGGGAMSWNENPIIDLGYYLGVLSTEYALLKNSGQNTDETVRELFFALWAFNRVDRIGDQFWGGTTTCSPNGADMCNLNGFFIRDDVPDFNVLNASGSLNHNLTAANVFNPSGGAQINGMYWANSTETTREKTFDKFDPDDNVPAESGDVIGLEPSTDEIVGLVEGLSLVAKFIDPNVTFNGRAFQDGETGLREEAMAIAARVAEWASRRNSWIYERPNGDEANTRTTPPDRPGFIIGRAFPFNMAVGNILGVSHNQTDYYNTSMFYDEHAWHLFLKFTGVLPSQQRHLTLSLAVMAGPLSFGMLSFPQQKVYNIASTEDWQTYYLMYYNVLHGASSFQLNRIQPRALSQLNFAPCEGPSCTNSIVSHGWGGIIRFHANKDAQNCNWPTNGDSNDTDPNCNVNEYCNQIGQPNGLDYMLLHNLYYLSYPTGMPVYQNYMNRTVSTDYPTTSNGQQVGTSANPTKVIGFETLTYDGTITNTGGASPTVQVEIKAGNEVVLGSGFIAQTGSFVEIDTELFTCPTAGDFLYARQSGGDSTEGRSYVGYIEKTTKKHSPITLNQEEQTGNPEFTEEDQKVVENFHKNMIVYPNPNNGSFTLVIPSQEQAIIVVTNMLGAVVLQAQTTENATQLNLTNFGKGIYIVEARQGEQVYREKVVFR